MKREPVQPQRAACLLALFVLLALASPLELRAQPLHPYLRELTPAERSPGRPPKFANLSPGACRAELRKRKIAVRTTRASGVASPVRLVEPVDGVRYLAPGPRSTLGVLDCRLVLTFSELSKLLHRHGVVQVTVGNYYRPRSRLPGRRTKSQHAYGLAADIIGFTLEDGRTLQIDRDWHGLPGGIPCGPGSDPIDPTEEAVLLRNLVCEIAAEGLFNHILTPNYNAAHADHIHVDIKRGDKTRVVR